MSEDMYRHPFPDEIDPFAPHLHAGVRWQHRALDKVARRARRLWALVRRGVLREKDYEAAMEDLRQRYGIDWRLTPRYIEPGPIYPVQPEHIWQDMVPRIPYQGPAFEFKRITGRTEEE